MTRQRGQSVVEFALVAPMIMLLIFGAIYGGAMFIQFLNFNNEARTIARQIAVTTNADKRQELIDKCNDTKEEAYGIYYVKLYAEPSEDGTEITVRYTFNRTPFPFDFPPAHFATSFTMRMEDAD